MLHDQLNASLPAVDRSEGEAPGTAQGQSEIARLLAVMSDQMADADRRHCAALEDMRQRLNQLGTDARIARPQVPQEFAPAFSRIEDALSQLAERIADARSERLQAATIAAPFATVQHSTVAVTPAPQAADISAPFALKSATAAAIDPAPAYNWAGDFARTRPETPAADPFDIVDNGTVPTGDTWSLIEAEALTRVYEDAALDPVFETPLTPPPAVSNVVAMPSKDEAPVSMPAPTLVIAANDGNHISDDRKWLEDRFTELASRLQDSFNETPVHEMLAALDERLSQLETHMGVSLQDVARRSDVEGLKIVEAHIEEMSRHLEQTHGQLGRLDSIESQLNEVVEHLAAQFENRSSAQPAFQPGDMQRIAEEAAQSVATRFAGTMSAAASSPAANNDQLAEVRGMLESFITERRDGDEHTALMFDTMQQALIRVLDRIDAMENAPSRFAAIEPVAYPYAAAAAAQPQAAHYEQAPAAAPAPAAEQSWQQPAYEPEPQYAPEPAQEAPDAYYGEPEPAFEPEAPVQPAADPGPSDGIRKLRQDMIADAQRAKARAAAEQAALAADQAAGGKPARGRPGVAAGQAAAGRTGSISPKFLIAAAVLAALFGGVWFMGSGSAPETPAAQQVIVPEAAMPALPGAQAPAAAAPAPAQTQKQQAPVKPQAQAPAATAPASANSFIVDEDETANAVAAPGPVSSLEAPLPGLRFRQSADPISAADLALLERQRQIATMSNQLGETAVNTMTPAAYMQQTPVTAVTATQTPAQPAAVPGTVASEGTAVRSSALDLPPATVGPLSLRLAAAKGDPSAEFEAGSRLAEGKGTSQNFKEAFRWYSRSAAQGFAQAQYRLGTLYERGLGVKADPGQAGSWYQRAAEQGNVKAMHNLAVLSANRQSGSPDYDSAAKWFTAAAERDLKDSQYNLGVLYESGLGVAKDMKQAMKWYGLAARSGDAESVRRRDLAKAQLSDTEQAEVAGQLAAFKAIRIEDQLVNDARAAGEDWKKRMADNGNTDAL